jgi:3-oxoadipate enol-lactonase
MPEVAEVGFAPVPSGQLYFERVGRGPAIVLIHSAFLDRREWDPQFRSYAQDHTVVRYDVRGSGRSSGDRTGSSDGEDLVALLNFLNLTKSFVLGNSNGARIASEFAAGLPDRTMGLVLVAGAPHDLEPTKEEKALFMDTFPDREGPLIEMMRGLRKAEAIERILDIWAPSVPPEERSRLRGIASENYDRFVQFSLAAEPEGRMPAYPVAATLREGRLPILSIAGAHDEPAMNRMMSRFAAETPSAAHFELANGDHTASLSAPTEFDARVREFLGRVEAGEKWPPPRD